MIIWEGNFNVDSDTIESISSELKTIPKHIFWIRVFILRTV